MKFGSPEPMTADYKQGFNDAMAKACKLIDQELMADNLDRKVNHQHHAAEWLRTHQEAEGYTEAWYVAKGIRTAIEQARQ